MKIKLIKLLKKRIVVIFLLYIVCIFLFALIYRLLPHNSFYHSTVQYENEYFNKDVGELSNALTTDLLDVIKRNIPSCIKIVEFRVNNISFDSYPDNVKLKYFFSFEDKSKADAAIGMGFSDSLIIGLKTYMKIDQQLFVLYSQEENEFITENVQTRFDYKNMFHSKINTFVEIDSDIYNELIGLGNAYKGFPKKLSGEFSRMLYLSIGIATTMTFGDIVPITKIARTFIIIQNLITLIFLGLIIDAIVSLIKKTET